MWRGLASLLFGAGCWGGDWGEEDFCPNGEEEYGEQALNPVPEVIAFEDGVSVRLTEIEATLAGYVGCGHFDPADLRTLDRIEVRVDPNLDLAKLPGRGYLTCERLDWASIEGVPVEVRVFGTRNQSLSLRGNLILDGDGGVLHVGAPCSVWAAPPCDVGVGGVSLSFNPAYDRWHLHPPGGAKEHATSHVEAGPCTEETP